ncbi:dephospho-CoA kinase [Thermosulfidibacter takaii ABI70S6]|uniref:Dephospho-CoA kinase n=1 Tax=Thermosulfidibacter takaii (strain DSM 17441 / JCM 13301 / NBRC 103674 / ABI70S6) TaxID=1298851 RepID=A0A0S3QTW3_THET7|nr:dephospho-CoA kinase [Thermosulfidibacter takaii]BAT71780.1 dephospho-CoA kinase [Thermosulfidibacter takaii ABI70S6]
MGRIIKVGLTGGIATGKSTVAKIIREHLIIPIINSDEIAHEIIKKDKDGYYKILKAFGESILDENGEIDRKKLGQIVFSDAEKRKLLESILHPMITAEIDRRVRELEKEGKKIVVLEIPLLFEKNLTNRVDYTVVVYTPEDLQIKRLMERDELSREEALARLKSQIPIDQKTKMADFVIDNSKSLEETKQQTIRVFEEILKYAERCRDNQKS